MTVTARALLRSMRLLVRQLPAAADRQTVQAFLKRAGVETAKDGKLWILHPTDEGTDPPPETTDKNLRRRWGRPVGLFPSVSKMPGHSFNLPAGAVVDRGICAVAGLKRADAICRSCYAMQNQYLFPTAQRALWQRLQWVERLLDQFGPRKGAVFLAAALRWAARPRQGVAADARRQRRWAKFRLHDSGEFYSSRYAELWARAAALVQLAEPPEIDFWFPTRVWALIPEARRPGASPALLRRRVRNHPILRWLVGANGLANTTVRPSSLSEHDPAPEIPGLAPGTGIWSEEVERHLAELEMVCVAPTQGGACWDDVECSACWLSAVAIYYVKHGSRVEGEKRGGGKSLAGKRLRDVRQLVQIGPPPKMGRGRGARPSSRWLLLDSQVDKVFARRFSSRREAARWARAAQLLLVREATGAIETPSGRCVGRVVLVAV